MVVAADRVTFEHIDFVADARAASNDGDLTRSPALIWLYGAECSFVDCSFQSSAGEPNLSTAIRWTQSESTAVAAVLPSGRVRLRDCIFRRVAAGIDSSRRGAIVLDAANVLHLGPGPLVRVRHCPAADESLQITLAQVTLREAASLVELQDAAGVGNASFGQIAFDATGCVIAPHDNQPLLAIASDQSPAQLLRGLKWTGQGSVLAPRAEFARWLRSDRSSQAIDDSTISISGLVRGQVFFASSASGSPAGSRVIECQAPLVDSESLGANTSRLPAEVEAAAPSSR
jgi:hypothetical protein